MEPEASEDLVRHLEALTGCRFRTRQDIEGYLRRMAESYEAHAAQVMRRSRQVKHIVLALALALAFMQYYWMDVLYQIATLPEITVTVPVLPRG